MIFTRVVIASLLVLSGPIGDSANPLSLGGQALGEKLSDFKRAFPSAICGSSIYGDEVTNPYELADKTKYVGCCLDAPGELSQFSRWEIVSVVHCYIRATFYRERLQELKYVVNISTVNSLLPEFTRQFGTARLDRIVRFDGVHGNRAVAWSSGLDILWLVTAKTHLDGFGSGVAEGNDAWPDATVVIVQLLRVDQ